MKSLHLSRVKRTSMMRLARLFKARRWSSILNQSLWMKTHSEKANSLEIQAKSTNKSKSWSHRQWVTDPLEDCLQRLTHNNPARIAYWSHLKLLPKKRVIAHSSSHRIRALNLWPSLALSDKALYGKATSDLSFESIKLKVNNKGCHWRKSVKIHWLLVKIKSFAMPFSMVTRTRKLYLCKQKTWHRLF